MPAVRERQAGADVRAGVDMDSGERHDGAVQDLCPRTGPSRAAALPWLVVPSIRRRTHSPSTGPRYGATAAARSHPAGSALRRMTAEAARIAAPSPPPSHTHMISIRRPRIPAVQPPSCHPPQLIMQRNSYGSSLPLHAYERPVGAIDTVCCESPKVVSGCIIAWLSLIPWVEGWSGCSKSILFLTSGDWRIRACSLTIVVNRVAYALRDRRLPGQRAWQLTRLSCRLGRPGVLRSGTAIFRS